MDSQIESTVDRLILLWFSERVGGTGLWVQRQVTLVNAQLKLANLELSHTLPRLRSCTVTKVRAEPEKWEFHLEFDPGTLLYECDDIVCSEFSRRVRVIPEPNP